MRSTNATPAPTRWTLRLLGRLSLRTEAIVASAVVALLTAASVVGLHWCLRRAEERAAMVLHTREVMATAQAVARGASDAQGAVRGYALTHDRSFLDQYDAGNDEFNREIGALAALVADHGEQLARVDEIRALYRGWREEAARSLVSTPAPGELTPEQRRIVIAGKSQMDLVRARADELIAVESRLLRARQEANLESSRRVDRASLFGTALVVLVGAAGAVLFAHRVGKHLAQLTASAHAFARGDLRHRVDVRRKDEIGSLARSFNAMAEQIERQRRDEAVVKRMREMLHAAQSTADAQKIIAHLAPQCLPDNPGRLFLLNPSRNYLAHAGGWGPGLGDEGFAPGDCWSFSIGRLHEVRDPARDVACSHRHAESGPTVCIPLMAQGETVGLLHVGYDGVAIPRLATEVGEILALTLANLRLRETMRNQATRDPLTGLFNRRYLEETFHRELARSGRSGQSIGVIVMDVDHFKRFNDTHGHGAGDALLKEVAGVLQRAFRTADVVCRYGGEEFVAVLPDCDVQNAVRRAEEVRVAVSALSVTYEGRTLGRVTLSAGVAAYPPHGRDAESLIHAADRALYRSKSDGRDRVTTADDLPFPRAVAG